MQPPQVNFERSRSKRESTVDLQKLLSSAAQGDAAAFSVFYRNTQRFVLFQARRIVGELHCEDVAADTFLQAWLSLASFDASRGDPLVWLTTIARSRALDRLRREKLVHGGLSSAPETQQDDSACERPGPEQCLAHAQARRRLGANLCALRGKERQVISLGFYEGLTHLEISQHINMALGTVKTLSNRAQAKLRFGMEAVAA